MPKMNKIKEFYNKMSIKNKIAFIYAAVFILVIFVVSCFMLVNSVLYYKNSSATEINETLDTIERYILEGNEVTPEKISVQNKNPYIIVRVMEVYNGVVIPEKPDDFPLPPDGGDKFKPPHNFGRNAHDFRMDNIKGDAYLYNSRNVSVGSSEYVIQAFRIYNHEIKLMNRLGIILIIENIIAVIVAIVIGRALSTKMLKPVRKVAEVAMKISEENFNQRIEEPETDDEIKELVHAFNDMLERLEISFERQNQFISDASHELKTPISVIQGYTNLLSRWGKNDEEVLDEAIESIKSETEHMTMLLKRLLFWAKNDVNNSISISQLCIEELLEEIKKEAEVMELQAKLFIKGDETTQIMGDYHLIKQMIWIFVENAVKYSGEKNCEICFETATENERAILKIKDNGIGIKEEDINNIFERFYRSDKSRNKEIPGFGLGLSIAKWISDHHNGKISVNSAVGEGTEFVLSFPVAK